MNIYETYFPDPLEINAPLLKQPLHFMPNQSEAPSWLTETKTKIENSSGFIIVCAEYNATIPPALTNLLDYFPPKIFRHKPASIVTYSMGEFTSGGMHYMYDFHNSTDTLKFQTEKRAINKNFWFSSKSDEKQKSPNEFALKSGSE